MTPPDVPAAAPTLAASGRHPMSLQGPDCKGRVAPRELPVASDGAALARQQGMTAPLQDGVLKVLGGFTSLTQVNAVADR